MSQNLGFIASVFLQSIRDSCVSGFSTPWEHIVPTARRKWWNHLLHLCTSVASLVSQNTEEFKRSRLGYDFRGFFSCTHLKGTLCVTVSRWFFCRTFSFSFLGLSPFSISSIFVSPFPFMLAETIPGKPLSKLPSSLGFGSDGCIYTCWRLLCVSECYSVTCRENNDFR